jgi:hypothetical protein
MSFFTTKAHYITSTCKRGHHINGFGFTRQHFQGIIVIMEKFRRHFFFLLFVWKIKSRGRNSYSEPTDIERYKFSISHCS